MTGAVYPKDIPDVIDDDESDDRENGDRNDGGGDVDHPIDKLATLLLAGERKAFGVIDDAETRKRRGYWNTITP